MDKYSYYEPDYNLLNRRARRCKNNGSSWQGSDIIDRILSRDKNSAAKISDPELRQRISETISEIKQNIDWTENIFNASYVAFDTETTGLRPYRGDEIISLGAVIIENGRLPEKPSFYRLVNPGRPVPARAQSITGITDDMLQGKPGIGPVLLDFLKFAGPRILVAHNAPFDLAFLNKILGESIGRRIVNPVIDTVLLTSALYYSYGDYSLENLACRLNFSLEGRHNALSDARIAGSLFLKLLPDLEKKGIKTLQQLSLLFSDSDPARGYPLIY